MSENTSMDRMRALLEGRLSPEEASRLREEIAADPDSTEVFEALGEIHAATAPGAETVPACRVTFEELAPQIAEAPVVPLRPRRWLAVAAALLVAATAVAGVMTWTSPWFAPPTVVLTATYFPPRPYPDHQPPEPLPERIATWRPVADGNVQWLADLDEGQEIARASGRHVVLFVHHPTCPMCVEMEGGAFRDRSVQDLLAEFVPVRVDVTTAPEEFLERYLRAGWPYLGALDHSGKPWSEFPGLHDAPQLASELDEARRKEPREGEPLAWETVNRLGALSLRMSGDALTAERLRAAEAVLAADPDGAFGMRALHARADVAFFASQRLSDAQLLATQDVSAADRLLEDGVALYAGTPMAADFAAVLDALRDRGVFPTLVSKESQR